MVLQAGPVRFRRSEGYSSAGYKFIEWIGDTDAGRDRPAQQGAFVITLMVEGPERGIYAGTAFGQAMESSSLPELFSNLEQQYEREKVFGPEPVTKIRIP